MRRRVMTTAMAAVAVAVTAAALVVRAQPVTSFPRLVFAVGAPYAVVAAIAGVFLAVLSRRFLLSVAVVSLLLATLVIQVRWYYLGKPRDIGSHIDIRVLSSNLFKGRADAKSFVELAKSSADVITVAELTPDAIDRFSRAGVGDVFPHAQLFATRGVGGVGIWSRYPIAPVSAPRHPFVLMPAVRLEIVGLEFHPLVAATHVMSPVAGDENTVDEWRQGMAAAKAQLANFAADAGPGAVIIGGDYNSTPDLRQFRDLLTEGYQDAVDQTGSGFAPTYPGDTWFPPLITIDHVLTRHAAASSVRTVKIKGSDHRGLLVTVQVPN